MKKNQTKPRKSPRRSPTRSARDSSTPAPAESHPSDPSHPSDSSHPSHSVQPFPGRAKIIPNPDKILLPFQRAWVDDHSRLKIAEKSRQVGWTWATAFSITRRKSDKSATLDAWISSRDELQAGLFLEDCKHFAAYLKIPADALSQSFIDEKGQSSSVLRFATGVRIHSMSSNPDAQAGKRGDRILDEFALHLDPRKLYSIAFPGITWGGSLEIFSTHRGTANFFNELVNEVKHNGNPKGFSLHSVSLKDALDQGFLYKLQSKLPPGDPRLDMDEADYFSFIRSGCADMESFQEEFCCQPSDDNSAFLSYDLIVGCEASDPLSHPMGEGQGEGRPASNELYAGVDVGRDKDLTVIWLFERVGDVLQTRSVTCLQKQTFDAQEAALYEILEQPNFRRCCIDQTGIGRQFAERAITRFGPYRVEGVQFTSGVKEELAYPVRAAFEKKTIRIPNDKYIRSDLRSIRKEVTASGNIRFSGERTTNGHADRFWALALALHAAKPAPAQFSATLC